MDSRDRSGPDKQRECEVTCQPLRTIGRGLPDKAARPPTAACDSPAPRFEA
ncbi:hypothetical protein M3650_30890 [Paenibacillus sp. MER TA 81-3]|nr:hypothetical protein [Paenibacillus sp. MER TA 81-3]